MKIKLLILVTILSLILAGAALADPKKNSRKSTRSGSSSSSSSSSKGPRLAIKNTVQEIRGVNAGSPVIQDFVLANTGGEALRILQVAAACGCTVATYDQSIAPGQSGKVSLRVNIAPELTGRRVSQSAIVETNDPRNQYVTLTIIADVKPAPGQEPVEPERRGKKSGEGEKTSLRKSKSGKDAEAVEAETPPDIAEPIRDEASRNEPEEKATPAETAPEPAGVPLTSEDEPAKAKPADRRFDGRAKTTLNKPESSDEEPAETEAAPVQEIQPEPDVAPPPQPAPASVEPQAAPEPPARQQAATGIQAEPAGTADEDETEAAGGNHLQPQ